MFLLSKDLRRLNHLYLRLIAKELPEPLTEYMAEIIILLAKSQEKVTQKKLSAVMQVDESRMVMMIKKLSRLDYIWVEQNRLDHREHLLQLTDLGKGLVCLIENAVEQVNKVAHQHLGSSSIAQFHNTIRQIEQNLASAVSLLRR